VTSSAAAIEWWFTSSLESNASVLVADQRGPKLPSYSVNVTTHSSTLIISDVQYPQDLGKYTCFISTGGMTRNSSAYLTMAKGKTDHKSMCAVALPGLDQLCRIVSVSL
jgi:hypothetical protein